MVHQPILRAVGVLKFVDEHVLELLRQLAADLRIFFAQPQRLQNQVVEIDAVLRLQPLLIDGIHAADDVAHVVPAMKLGRRQPLVLGAVDGGEHGARRGKTVGDLQILEHARHQRALVVVVEDDEVAGQPDALGVHAQEARAGGVEGAGPDSVGARPLQPLNALLHLAGGLVGERDREDAPRRHATAQKLGDAMGEHPSLARSGARQDQERPVAVHNGRRLRRIEPVCRAAIHAVVIQYGRCDCHARPRWSPWWRSTCGPRATPGCRPPNGWS